MPMKNDRMKRAALVLMLSACALLLGGCAGQIEQRTMLDLSDMPVQTPAEAPMEDGAQDKRMLSTLYYLSRDGAELLPVTCEITARGGESRAQAALEALLAACKGTYPRATAALERMLRQPEAQALLARLQQLDPSSLQNAVNLAFRGDTAGAKEALSPILRDQEVQRLTEQMRDGHGGI